VKPYYESGGITIYHGDCREILPAGLEYDTVISDPPYGIHYNEEDEPQAKHVASHRCQVASVFGDDKPFDPRPWIDRPAILWGANCYSDKLPALPTWLVWDKVTRNGLKLRIAECEFAWTNCVARSQVFRYLWSGAYRQEERGEYWHPTQKPVDLMRWCISLARPVPTIILDPFMGSGTTLRAAKDLGRKAIGIEIEEKYCEIAALRLQQQVIEFPRNEKQRAGIQGSLLETLGDNP